MKLFSRNAWSGHIDLSDTNFTDTVKARGLTHGHPWYFQLKKGNWFIEIAEDQEVTPDCLPIVGFGYSGWLYESTEELPTCQTEFSDFLSRQLDYVFKLFANNGLPYIPAVTGCND